jgi:tetratricopeptide (TPR) repeat protein
MKCDVCGTESDFEASFVKDRSVFRSEDKNLCPSCWTRRQNKSQGRYQAGVVVAGIVGYILLWQYPASFIGYFLTALFLINLFLVLAIIPHELGHVMAGRLAGWRVFAVVMGIGKQVFKFRLQGIIFLFNLIPVSGITQVAPVDTRWFQTKRFLIFLAGPAVNAAIAAAILLFWWDAWQDFNFMSLPRAARFCLYANLWVLAINLWPHHSKVTHLDTDGKQMLKAFSRKPEKADQMLAARFAMEAMMRRDEYNDAAGALDWCNRGLASFPNNVHLLNVSGVLCLDQGNHSRARDIFLQLLPQETKPVLTRYIILNNIAYVDALIGDPELLPEADAYSKEAYAAAGWVPAITGTRGNVLVAMGQVEDGIRLLKESFEKAASPHSKAENACHLAIANVRIGNQKRAEKFLKLARELNPHCRLIERAHTEVQSAEQK